MLDLTHHISVTVCAIGLMLTLPAIISMMCMADSAKTIASFFASMVFIVENYMAYASFCVCVVGVKDTVNNFVDDVMWTSLAGKANEIHRIDKRAAIISFLGAMAMKKATTEEEIKNDATTNTPAETNTPANEDTSAEAKKDDISVDSSTISGADTHKD
jgi:hypothetical protein